MTAARATISHAPFVEWKQLPRSITVTINGMTASVWPFFTTKKVYKFTVSDVDGVYVDCGMSTTQDEACERCLKAMGV